MDPQIKNVIPLPAAYVANPRHSVGVTRNGEGGQRPVVAVAETAPGVYQACVLSMEGRLELSGVVHPERHSAETSVIRSLNDIATAIKSVVTLLQGRLK